MKKSTLLLLFIGYMMAQSVLGQLKRYSEYDFAKDYLKQNHIKGKVKKLSEAHLSMEPSPNAWGYLYSYQEFDTNGNITKISKFDQDFEEITSEINFRYDEKGNLVESKKLPYKYFDDSIYIDTAAITKDTLLYNIEGSLVAIIKHKHNRVIGSFRIKYNKKGQVIEEFDSLKTNTILKYDSNNCIIEEIGTFNGTGSYSPSIINKYDRKGNMVLHKEGNDRIDSFKYENKFRKVEDASYLAGKLNWKTVSFYNKKKELIKVQYFNSENKLTSEIEHGNNNATSASKATNILEKTSYNKMKYSYYDKKGNWLKSFVGDKSGYIINRTIEYYK
ncbi:MAG: hypothetical protein SGJ10_00035 [Bacteroidota bacterium]|nr:hypothetical protein [Bacteroidota bacterium]